MKKAVQLFQLLLLVSFTMQAQDHVKKQVDSLKYVAEIPYMCEHSFSLIDVYDPGPKPLPLGCGDKLLWKVVMLKEKAIPYLLEELDNMKKTPASFPLQGGQCTVADVAYIALQEIIHDIPTAELLQVNPEDYDCGYCYYHYNIRKKRERKKFKKAVEEWYNNNKFKLVWINKGSFSTCDCSGPHPNGGHYKIINLDDLRGELDTIRQYDQVYRNKLSIISNFYQKDTAELNRRLQSTWKLMHRQDSINLIRVKAIIDKYGWLGPDEIGEAGNSTLFLVIQHADVDNQEKYLPLLKEAVRSGNASPDQQALLEDRIAIYRGRRQLYGSQLAWNMADGTYYVLPLEDPDNVDERRKKVGLPPFAEYLASFGLSWDVEQYKKDLPGIEALTFKK